MWRAEQVGHTLGIKTARCIFIFHQLQVHVLARVINHLLKVILQTAKERSVDGRVLPAALQQKVPAETGDMPLASPQPVAVTTSNTALWHTRTYVHVTAAAPDHVGSPACSNLMVDVTWADACKGGCPCMEDRHMYSCSLMPLAAVLVVCSPSVHTLCTRMPKDHLHGCKGSAWGSPVAGHCMRWLQLTHHF